jgi:cell wall assembly regulator SMI1
MTNPHDVVASWSRVEVWLKTNLPEALGKLCPGAIEAEIDETERLLGITLPEDVKQFYRVHNCTDDLGLFPSSDPSGWDNMAFSPLPLEQVRSDWEDWKGLVEIGQFADLSAKPAAGIRADWWNCGWIPIASNGGGDFQCIDMAPTETGRSGQVISMWHENGRRELIASSLADYLRVIADALESGRFRYQKGSGIVEVKQ